MESVTVRALPGGDHLLDGELSIEIQLDGGEVLEAALELPPGSPARPPTSEQIERKLELCAPSDAAELARVTWDSAPAFLRDVTL